MKPFNICLIILSLLFSFTLASDNEKIQRYELIFSQAPHLNRRAYSRNYQVINLCYNLNEKLVPLVALEANFWILMGDKGELSLEVISRNIIEMVFRHKERRIQGFLFPEAVKEYLISALGFEEILTIVRNKSKKVYNKVIERLLVQDDEIFSEMIKVIWEKKPEALFKPFWKTLVRFNLDEEMLQQVSEYVDFTDFLSKIRTLVSNQTCEFFKLCFPNIDFVESPEEKLEILDFYSHDKYGKLLFEGRNPKKAIETALAVLKLQKLMVETNCPNCNVSLLETITHYEHLVELALLEDQRVAVLALQIIRTLRPNSIEKGESILKIADRKLIVALNTFFGAVPVPSQWYELDRLYYMHRWRALSRMAKEHNTLDIMNLINSRGTGEAVWEELFTDHAKQMTISLSHYPGLSNIIEENINSFQDLKERVERLRGEFSEKQIIELGKKNIPEVDFAILHPNSLSLFYNLWVNPTSHARLKWLAKQPVFSPIWVSFLGANFKQLSAQVLIGFLPSKYREFFHALPIEIIMSIQIQGGLDNRLDSWKKYLQQAYEKMLDKYGYKATLAGISQALFGEVNCPLEIEEKQWESLVEKLTCHNTLILLHRANIHEFDGNNGLCKLSPSYYHNLKNFLGYSEWQYEDSKWVIFALKHLIQYLDRELDDLKITEDFIVDSLSGMLAINQNEGPTPFQRACIETLLNFGPLGNAIEDAFIEGAFEQGANWTAIIKVIKKRVSLNFVDYAILVGQRLGKYIKIEGLPYDILRLEEWIQKNSRDVSELERLRLTNFNTYQVIMANPLVGCLTVPESFQAHMITDATITEKLWAWMLKNAQVLGFDQKGWFQALEKANEKRATPLDLVGPLRDRLGGRQLRANERHVYVFDEVYGFFEKK